MVILERRWTRTHEGLSYSLMCYTSTFLNSVVVLLLVNMSAWVFLARSYQTFLPACIICTYSATGFAVAAVTATCTAILFPATSTPSVTFIHPCVNPSQCMDCINHWCANLILLVCASNRGSCHGFSFHEIKMSLKPQASKASRITTKTLSNTTGVPSYSINCYLTFKSGTAAEWPMLPCC